MFQGTLIIDSVAGPRMRFDPGLGGLAKASPRLNVQGSAVVRLATAGCNNAQSYWQEPRELRLDGFVKRPQWPGWDSSKDRNLFYETAAESSHFDALEPSGSEHVSHRARVKESNVWIPPGFFDRKFVAKRVSSTEKHQVNTPTPVSDVRNGRKQFPTWSENTYDFNCRFVGPKQMLHHFHTNDNIK